MATNSPTMTFDDERQQVLPPQPSRSGELTVASFGGVVMAQKVDQERSLQTIERKIQEACELYGTHFFYQWTAKGGDGKTSVIEGVTIQGSAVLRQIWRNNMVETIVTKMESDHVMLASRFVDYETGNTTIRPFRQRLNMKFGKMDAARAMEVQISIGVSKSERNVVLDALRIQRIQMLEFAKKGTLAKIANNLPGAKDKLLKMADDVGVSIDQMEKYVERKEKDWVAMHILRLVQAIRAIEEGAAVVSDIFVDSPPSVITDEASGQAGGKEGDGNQQGAQAGAGSAPGKKRAPRAAAKADVVDKAADAADGQGGVVGKVGEASAGQAGNAPQEQTAEGPKPGGAGAPAGKSEPAQSESKAAAPAASQKELSETSNRQEPVADKAAGSAPNPTEAAEEDWGWGQEQ
jgi:hypothetical protein